MTKKMFKTALILVDLQNDFCQGGSLAVPNGDQVISIANELQPYFSLVIATQDWHPADHISFASNHPNHKVGDVIKINEMTQVLWPDHCIQGTPGAAFHPAFNTTQLDKIIQKGTDRAIDSYSAFFDNAHLRSTGLNEYLSEQGVRDIYIMGLATDYCVKYSCLDAAQLGLNVFMIEDASRGVDLQAGDVKKSIEEMRVAGVKIVTLQQTIKNIENL